MAKKTKCPPPVTAAPSWKWGVRPGVDGWLDRAEAEAHANWKRGRHLLAYVRNYAGCGDAWIEAAEADQLDSLVLCWGVTDSTGEKMLDCYGDWNVVA